MKLCRCWHQTPGIKEESLFPEPVMDRERMRIVDDFYWLRSMGVSFSALTLLVGCTLDILPAKYLANCRQLDGWFLTACSA